MKLTHNDTDLKLIVGEIHDEISSAEAKYPDWPDDPIHGVAIMAEESGEAVRACLNMVYHGADRAEYRKELVQTAAMAIRAIIGLDRS
jgi:hypothetical protein